MWRPSQWLTGWDASTWALTSSDLNFGSAVVGVVEMSGRAQFEEVAAELQVLADHTALLCERVQQTGIPLLPGRVEYTQRCEVLDHLSHSNLPDEPSWSAVRDIIVTQLATPFSADKPAWRAVLVTGPGNSSAPVKSFLVMALHHALVDGNGAMRIAEHLLHGNSATKDPAGDLEQRDLASALIDMASQVGAKAFVEATNLLAQVLADPSSATERIGDLVRSGLRTANPFARPLSSLLAPRSGQLAASRLQTDLLPLTQVAKLNSVSLTSVILTGVSIGLSNYHQRHGDVSSQVRVNVPVALQANGSQRNALSVSRVVLDLEPIDPVVRLKQTHEVLLNAKSEPALQWTSVAADISRLLPLEAFAGLIGGADLTVSSLRGPTSGGTIAGRPVTGLTPFAPVFGAGASLNFLTFNDQLFAGICADGAAVAHLKRFKRDCLRGFAEIAALA